MPLKSNSLRDKDIINIFKSQSININSIYMEDELPRKLKKWFYVVKFHVNLQELKDGDGSHWTSLYYNTKCSSYFDPYGFVPPVEVESKIKSYIYDDINRRRPQVAGSYSPPPPPLHSLSLSPSRTPSLQVRWLLAHGGIAITAYNQGLESTWW